MYNTKQNKTKHNKRKQNKTKKIINNYFIKKDICCDEDIEREKCINIIFDRNDNFMLANLKLKLRLSVALKT